MPARASRIGGLIAIALAVTAIATSRSRLRTPPTLRAVKLTRVGEARRNDRDGGAHRRPDVVRHGAIGAGTRDPRREARARVRCSISRATRPRPASRVCSGSRSRPTARTSMSTTPTRSGDTHIDEFAMNGQVADKSSRRNLLVVDQPQPNHNGGQLAFGPDGDLYIAFGDGGAADDEGPGHASGGNGQSLSTLLGKILRIDPTPSADAPYTVPPDNPFVGRTGARPEIWAYGLRNPWRFSFDADNGDLWIGDVGQDSWEEVDVAPATHGRDAGRGDNFGWNRLEGTHRFRGSATCRRGPARVRAIPRRRRVLGDRRLRVPRNGDPGARWQVRVHRLLRRRAEDPHAGGQREVPRPGSRPPSRQRVELRTRPPTASSTSSPNRRGLQAGRGSTRTCVSKRCIGPAADAGGCECRAADADSAGATHDDAGDPAADTGRGDARERTQRLVHRAGDREGAPSIEIV